MNETIVSLLYFAGVILILGITGFAMAYTWKRLETGGAKSLFMVLFLLFAFTFIFMMSLFTRSAEGMHNIMTVAYALILMIPFPWTGMVYEMNNQDTKDMWHFMVPWTIINFGGFIHFIFPIEQLGNPLEYTNCSLLGFVNRCDIGHSPFYYVLMGLLLFEILGANLYMFIYLMQPKQVKERAKYMLLVVGMTVGTIFLFLIGVVLDLPGGLDPLPLGIGILAVLIFNAIFNKNLLPLATGGVQALNAIDDLLLVVDADHFIQDVNLSTLQVFDMELSDLLDVQLEHAFIEYPEIINVFNHGLRHDTLDLPIGGELHTFTPTLREELDPLSRVVTGQRLELKDVTHQFRDIVQSPDAVTLDPLTQQYDRETFFRLGQKVLQNSHRLQQDAAIAVLNIDDFTQVNQRFSHLVGDQVLLELVDIINNLIRQSDLFARLEGDNLALLITKADEFSAYQICSRIKETIASHSFAFQHQEFQVTVSVGYTVYDGKLQDVLEIEDLLSYAVQAVEQSQTLGRNRLTFLPAIKLDDVRFVTQAQG